MYPQTDGSTASGFKALQHDLSWVNAQTMHLLFLVLTRTAR